MDEQTIAYLNAINQRFYAAVGASFDATRREAWRGWSRLADHLQPPLRVLDVGCGNGRFGVFLAQRFGVERIVYTGTDNADFLLVRAGESLSASGVAHRLITADIVSDPPDPTIYGDAYDLVVLFGVLHHIPDSARRAARIAELAARVAPGGVFAFAAWRFADYERFRARIIPWDAAITVETGDHLLDWRAESDAPPRYCHHVDDREHAALIDASGLKLIDDYRADGMDDAVNRYTILRRDDDALMSVL